DDSRYADQKNANIAEVIFNTNKVKHCVTGFSIGAGNVEIRFFDGPLEFALDGKIDTYLNNGKIEKLSDTNANMPKISKIYYENAASELPMMPFHTFEELIEYVKTNKINLIELILNTEKQLQNTSKQQVYDKMRSYWKIMQKSVDSGIKDNELSLLKLTGKDSGNINKYRQNNKLFDNIYGKAVAYAVAVNEINAKSGVIIACPTAGSCGILPGVLKAYNEIHKPDEDKILESLMIAGFFGMILFGDVSTAGADYGCQAEIGSAAAMAASALVYLEGGDIEQMIEGFTIAIKNSLGLICDPIAGLVEVPCVKRNGIYSSHAISAALMALSGVKSFVSPDEVILTMREVGERLNVDYKETGKAGLAKTRDGKEVELNFANEVKKFFN
ncbi:MAG: L-serine ammonia-lyase, iron-sulfur-dependent, subunit alpha, partial [Bacteroidales bacterium]|nr:L-serine ammonia-lyase, iron-sulfur-dependent, subunit alpha [Bacteroidales bacterium]